MSCVTCHVFACARLFSRHRRTLGPFSQKMKRKLAESGPLDKFVASDTTSGSSGNDSNEKKQKISHHAAATAPLPKTGTEADLPWTEADAEVYPFIYKQEMPLNRRGLFL